MEILWAGDGAGVSGCLSAILTHPVTRFYKTRNRQEEIKLRTQPASLDAQTLQKIEALIADMTLDEKLGMLHGDNVYDTKGVPRLGIPPFHFSDGPMGVRCEFDRETCAPVGNSGDFVTAFPCITALAATWNPRMAYENGLALGREVRGRGKDVSLSPGINIQRTPLCGRNFEYMSEDPCLISRMCVPEIRGLQENDIAACIKHFAVNNQETRRYDVNAEVDERALHELYLPGFQAAVREGPCLAVMGAYNRFRGEYCCHSQYLMQEVLRGRWGFDGIVISDWGAVHDTKKAVEAGVHFDMNVSNRYDEYYYANPLKERVLSGEIPEESVDAMVRQILKMMFRLHMMDPENRKPGACNTHENRLASLNVARESIVLLKNENGLLPLEKNPRHSIAVIGENANRMHAFGGGSSEVRALYEITPLLGIQMHLGGNFTVKYARGYSSDPGDAGNRQRLMDEACDLAAASDVVIYVGGLNHDYDMEGKDRPDLKLPYGQDALIDGLLQVRPDMVIVNNSGSPVEMGSWIDRAKAVVQYWYAGSEGGTALAEVLFGEVNPSGKLPITFPKSLEDTPVSRFGEFPGGDTVTYKEGIYVGYRYYDSFGVEPEFCFGHGLSYTDFSYAGMTVQPEEGADGMGVRVSFTVTNTGKVAGAETAQLYVSDPECAVPRPAKELKGFQKIFLNPGESKAVTLRLDRKAFCYYSVEDGDWKLEPGRFDILVGSSSRDIRLEGSVTL